jgi:RND superfamily putative drug exporter
MIVSITRWSLAHKRLVVLLWLTVTAIGVASAGAATKALSAQYSVPGRQGYETNRAIAQTFGTGGDRAPLVPVVTLPAHAAGSPTALAGIRHATAALQHALPGVRVASYASTHDRAFVSRNGRTTFGLVYPAARDYTATGWSRA